MSPLPFTIRRLLRGYLLCGFLQPLILALLLRQFSFLFTRWNVNWDLLKIDIFAVQQQHSTAINLSRERVTCNEARNKSEQGITTLVIRFIHEEVRKELKLLGSSVLNHFLLLANVPQSSFFACSLGLVSSVCLCAPAERVYRPRLFHPSTNQPQSCFP